jgi:hypothetical protein
VLAGIVQQNDSLRKQVSGLETILKEVLASMVEQNQALQERVNALETAGKKE